MELLSSAACLFGGILGGLALGGIAIVILAIKDSSDNKKSLGYMKITYR